jgi:hypothetical protein
MTARQKNELKSIDEHGLKIQGRWYLKFLPKSLGGIKAFRKNFQGFPPILGFIEFLLTSLLKPSLFPPPHPPPPPVLCASILRSDAKILRRITQPTTECRN